MQCNVAVYYKKKNEKDDAIRQKDTERCNVRTYSEQDKRIEV